MRIRHLMVLVLHAAIILALVTPAIRTTGTDRGAILRLDCVAPAESLSSIRRAELGEHLGTLVVGRWPSLVMAIGK
jgi:hypothetical protein